MDTNNDGGIDLKELSTEMAKHHIYFYKSKAEN